MSTQAGALGPGSVEELVVVSAVRVVVVSVVLIELSVVVTSLVVVVVIDSVALVVESVVVVLVVEVESPQIARKERAVQVVSIRPAAMRRPSLLKPHD